MVTISTLLHLETVWVEMPINTMSTYLPEGHFYITIVQRHCHTCEAQVTVPKVYVSSIALYYQCMQLGLSKLPFCKVTSTHFFRYAYGCAK